MGAPTFEQFVANREKYSTQVLPAEVLGSIDDGTHAFRGVVQKHEYEICGYRVKTLEEVERIARDNNIPLREFSAEVIPTIGEKCNVLVKFLSLEDRLKAAGL